MSAHTQGKWRVAVAGDSPSGGYMIIANDAKVGDLYIAYTIGGLREEEANAERIVQCVNSHDALVAAVQWSEQFHRRPDEGYSECFDRIAEVFYRETGYMRPGKDASPQAGQSIEERQAAWDEWIAAGIARARAALSLAGQQGQKT